MARFRFTASDWLAFSTPIGHNYTLIYAVVIYSSFVADLQLWQIMFTTDCLPSLTFHYPLSVSLSFNSFPFPRSLLKYGRIQGGIHGGLHGRLHGALHKRKLHGELYCGLHDGLHDGLHGRLHDALHGMS